MEKPVALGVDIGGSHITAALVDLETRTLLKNSIKRSPVNSQENKEVILSAWCDVINSAFQNIKNGNRNVGIAMPGPFNYEEGISLIKDQDKFKSLYQINVKEELAKRLDIAIENIHFINDAAGFLQGEVFAGAAKGNMSVLGLTLGTGLGSSLCLNYKAYDADLWNSAFLDGIAEDYLSTRWFVKRFKQLSGEDVAGVKELVGIVERNHFATMVFMEFGYNLAQFLIPIINKHKIDTVIVGGNIAQSFSAFAPELIATLKGNGIDTEIKISELKEHAALIGAASRCDLSLT